MNLSSCCYEKYWVLSSTEHLSSKHGMSLQAESSQSEPRVVRSWESCPARWFAPPRTWGQLCRKEQRALNWIRGFLGLYLAVHSARILSTKNSPKGSFLIAFCLFTDIKKTAWLFWEYVSLENIHIQQTASASNIFPHQFWQFLEVLQHQEEKEASQKVEQGSFLDQIICGQPIIVKCIASPSRLCFQRTNRLSESKLSEG